MITVGIDVGSITTKAVVMIDKELRSFLIEPTGYDARASAQRVFDKIIEKRDMNVNDIDCVISTGYGRKNVPFADKTVTEITCHASGAYFINPAVRTVIDIGGQDSKVIVLNDRGRVMDFVMNDKCAAGTGRFLEVMARALEVNLDQFGEMSLQAATPASISSLCTVFAESEVISLIAKGEKRENIIAGIHESVGARVAAMALRVGIRAPVMMTGGVAENTALIKALEKKINQPIERSPQPQIAGAIGASLIGFDFIPQE